MPGVKPRYAGGGGVGPWPAPQEQAGPRARTARGAAGSCAQYKAPKRNGPGEPGPVTCDQRRSDLADVLRLQALGTLSDLELHRIALGKAAEALSLDRREVDEHVRTRLLRDKAKALRVVEPLHLTLCQTVQTSALRGTAPEHVRPWPPRPETGSNKNRETSGPRGAQTNR